ncbi:MAG TPA: NADH-quinone oxidoreductase subunit L, partial [Candidatus Omnitrophota bacterium]|nr:NADH-quinone oxidoreductase subunit L [Candidatus Omnitrophota bacterium]
MFIQPILLLILAPLAAGVVMLFLPKRVKYLKEALLLIFSVLNLLLCLRFFHKEAGFFYPWGQYGIDFSLRLYTFNSFILVAVSGFALLIALYSCAFMSSFNKAKYFFSYFLFSLGFVNGAVLADNLVILLFFWEGLLLSIFGLIAIGNKDAFRTAVKALIIVGVTDLCMMVGIAITG